MNNNQQHYDFYVILRKRIFDWSESKKGKQHQWKEIVLLIPDLFHLLMRLSADRDVPLSVKTRLIDLQTTPSVVLDPEGSGQVPKRVGPDTLYYILNMESGPTPASRGV